MDFETMYNESEKVYKEQYSTGEYCHEQSFKWGFQEGYDCAVRLLKDSHLEKTQKVKESEFKYKIGDVIRVQPSEWWYDNGETNYTLMVYAGQEFKILDIVKIGIKDCGYRYVIDLPHYGRRYIKEEQIECKVDKVINQ